MFGSHSLRAALALFELLLKPHTGYRNLNAQPPEGDSLFPLSAATSLWAKDEQAYIVMPFGLGLSL
jgi:hypothetical protein